MAPEGIRHLPELFCCIVFQNLRRSAKPSMRSDQAHLNLRGCQCDKKMKNGKE